ncbi:AAA family ATPase [Scatolibacter rhodanostii]|uniref:AAA family ATPase n=1 Tax=Scatolibacter rhodanostii TaxID=2014781 RepID=UPI000C06E88C|nr:AAA family ATPase [Scatolibacter rhodanostii]
MSKVICVAGESGSGKTTSMRNLDPASTFYFDCDKKGLSWKGWKKQYNSANKNYRATSEAKSIEQILHGISEKSPQIKVAVIDTLNAIMIDDEFSRAKEKGYDKWQDLATSVWNLVSMANTLRDDLTVIFTAHTQTERDDSGFTFTRIKTSGKKLDKIVLESKFTTVLISKAIDGKYVFETHARNSTAKTPMGAFEQDEIPNDIIEVIKALEDY